MLPPDGRFITVVASDANEVGAEIVVVQSWFEELKRLVPTR